MEPNFSTPFRQGLLLQSFAGSKKDNLHQGATQPAPHQQLLCKNEKTEEEAPATATAMAMTSSSPTHSSAEDIFSDTMELANYLHRRVQEIGKQFRHDPLRIYTSEKLESAPEGHFSHALEPLRASAIAKACEPRDIVTAHKNAESCLRDSERAPLIPEKKPSMETCFDHSYNSEPNVDRASNTEELPLANREENFPCSSDIAGDSTQRKEEDAPSKYRKEESPNFSETGGSAISESVMKQGSINTEIAHLRVVAETTLSQHLNVRHCMSSVDSSDSDNCGKEGAKGSILERICNGADGNKSKEIDAMSEAMHFDTHRKKDEDGDAPGGAEPENDALDLLFDAVHVTFAERLAAKQGSPSSSHSKKHPPQKDSGAFAGRKPLQLEKTVQTTKKGNDLACLVSGKGHESMQPGSNLSHRIQGEVEETTPDIQSDTPNSHMLVRTRKNRVAESLGRKELGRDSVSAVMRFRSLEAVSEVGHSNNKKASEKLEANKLDDEEVKRQEISDSLQSHLKGERERTWETQENTLAKEGHFSRREKRQKIADGDDMCKDGRNEQLPAIPAPQGNEQEPGTLSRRARLQVLPTKFSDSVLQPWKKGDRRKS